MHREHLPTAKNCRRHKEERHATKILAQCVLEAKAGGNRVVIKGEIDGLTRVIIEGQHFAVEEKDGKTTVSWK